MRPILENENRPASKPNWNVRYYNAFEAVDHDAWRVKIEGMVANPVELSLADILALPSITQVSRMVCVEGWSAKAEWVGFSYQALAELVQPTAQASWLYFLLRRRLLRVPTD